MLRPYPPFPSNVPHFMERVNTYCARVLPLVFDNSLSYYEFLGHMQCKLNEVIKALNSQNLVFVEFTHMIELELQNFEEYMDNRQQNFETEMQEEWTAFKTELETAWNDFKTQLESEWTAEQALNETFRTNMQNAFQNFQTLITTQQTSFETALRNQQNQFQTDMTSRQNTFEDTMEDNFEQWKIDTLAALQAGIQQFEQDALAAITAAMPGVVQDLTEQTYIPSGTGSENPISGAGVADALLSTVPTMVDSLTQQVYYDDNHHPISGMGVADAFSKRVQSVADTVVTTTSLSATTVSATLQGTGHIYRVSAYLKYSNTEPKQIAIRTTQGQYIATFTTPGGTFDTLTCFGTVTANNLTTLIVYAASQTQGSNRVGLLIEEIT